VARLRRAGFIVIGRTNMTEFAYSGIGINPHFGTPKGAWQRGVGHVPGDRHRVLRYPSSMAWRMARSAPTPAAHAGFRRPSTAFVGFKPTQRRVPLDGGVPLSFTARQFWAAGAHGRVLRGA